MQLPFCPTYLAWFILFLYVMRRFKTRMQPINRSGIACGQLEQRSVSNLQHEVVHFLSRGRFWRKPFVPWSSLWRPDHCRLNINRSTLLTRCAVFLERVGICMNQAEQRGKLIIIRVVVFARPSRLRWRRAETASEPRCNRIDQELKCDGIAQRRSSLVVQS